MRKLLGALAATALALTAAAGLTTTASAATPTLPNATHATSSKAQVFTPSVLNGTHTLVTGGLALENPGSSPNAGTQLDTTTVNGGTNQNWQFVPQSDGSYDLINSSSGLCAEVNGGSVAPGAVVDQWGCVGSANELWTLTPLSDGSYIVTSVNSGLVLTSGATVTQQVTTDSPQQQWTISSTNPALNGTNTLVTGDQALNDSSNGAVTTQSVNGSASQNWTFIQQPDGTYELFSPVSGLCATIDIAGVFGSTCITAPDQRWAITRLSNGSFTVALASNGQLLTPLGMGDPLTTRPDSNSPQQQWTVDSANPDLSGTHTLTLATSGLALDDPGSSPNAGTQLDTWALVGSANQNWQFVQQSDGSYELVNASSGLCAEVNGGYTNTGAVVDQWGCVNGSTNQLWNLTQLSNGSYIVSSVRSGLLLTTASTANGALVTQQVNTNSPQQQWTIN